MQWNFLYENFSKVARKITLIFYQLKMNFIASRDSFVRFFLNIFFCIGVVGEDSSESARFWSKSSAYSTFSCRPPNFWIRSWWVVAFFSFQVSTKPTTSGKLSLSISISQLANQESLLTKARKSKESRWAPPVVTVPLSTWGWTQFTKVNIWKACR